MFKSLREAGELSRNVESIFVGGWEPKAVNGSSRPGWSSREDLKKESLGTGPEVCWEPNGEVTPLGLYEMTEEEKDHFSSSVNSPLKPPSQNPNKDQNVAATASAGRKSSLSQGQISIGSFGVSSPTSVRPAARRRETSDSVPHPGSVASPSGGRTFRDDPTAHSPPPLLMRRRTDFREGPTTGGDHDRETDGAARDGSAQETSTFPSFLRRSVTGPMSASGAAPSSPWARDTGTFSPMGSFGNFGLVESPGLPPTPTEKRIGATSTRGGSRWSKFMGKDGSEEPGSRLADKASMSSLGKVNEVEAESSAQSWRDARAGRPTSNDTDPFGDEAVPSGSAALGGGRDVSPRHPQRAPGMATPIRNASRDGFDLSDVGMSSGASGIRESAHQQGSQRQQHGNEPLSPTETNPFQSPFTEKADSEDIDTDDSELHSLHHPGLSRLSGEPGVGGLGNAPRGIANAYDDAGGDRSQTSSTGPSRGFPSMSGLGGAGAWPTSTAPTATPDREKAGFPGPFGASAFGPKGDLQSPSVMSPGAGAFGASGGNLGAGGTAGRGSKLGSLFPAAMQAQMHVATPPKTRDDEGFGVGNEAQRFGVASAAAGRAGFDPSGLAFGMPGRETDSPLRGGKGIFDEMLFSSLDTTRASAAPDNSAQTPTTATTIHAPSQQDQPPSQGQPAPQPPQSQQRTMVMPDRMRWIYKDPQGLVQGPWSGLEMHDWFKAGFFSAELLVKKSEDFEYEPLGQMIRRIGNSREPFLVPQIGIPHGPANSQPSAQWSTPGTTPGVNPPAAQGGSVQPPFAGAFPSFGTTLTAEQQNALERRKQEEQFLMARQKEYLAQQQVIQKQMHQIPGAQHGVNPQLHHHSSAHSLQSQPSYGSITSPGQFQATPPQTGIPGSQGVPGFFDAQTRLASAPSSGQVVGPDFPSAGGVRDDELAALLARQSIGREGLAQASATHAAGQYQQEGLSHQQQVAAMLSQRVQLEREQAQYEAMQQSGPEEQQGGNHRLEEFNELRAQRDYSGNGQLSEGVIGKPGAHGQQAADLQQRQQQQQQQPQQQHYRTALQIEDLIARAQKQATPGESGQGQEVLSLTQQVQKAASAKQSPAASQPESVWGKLEKTGLPQPFPPPPQSISPLPAPAAQRSRQNLPDALNAETRSPQPTPPVDAPGAAASVAPWAKDANDGSRGPSLKEIQETEARKAAKAEEAASAARRALLEQERTNQPTAATPAPGLPTSSTWGSGTSPVTATGSTMSAWAKPLAGKGKAAQGGAGMKKSLSQIQREEETRKQKLAAANGASSAAAAPTAGQGGPGGKRYADLASKAAAAAQPPNHSGPWMTVGAGGKAKGAAGVAAPPGLRTVSTSAVPGVAKTRPAMTSTNTTGPSPAQRNANDEFTKWAKGALAKGLNSNINVDDFVQQLLTFPPEAEIIAESVYANSQTMDGRRFAEEFFRRRRLADKGVVEAASTGPAGAGAGSSSTSADSKGGAGAGGGWNEVAKKGPPAKEAEGGSSFKVVAAKKKGRK
ncbi:MAG: hypothetical protein M1832_004040 [Thelocarpon impressellum]|nr:MAG: hypothetical protein M1832_004040 [Thelocarpon impressellum]